MAGSRGEARLAKGGVDDIWWFLAILFATSAVFYAAGPLIGTLSGVTRANVPAAALGIVCPAIAALVVTARTGTGARLLATITARPRGARYWLLSIVALPVVVIISAMLTGHGDDFEIPGGTALGLAVVYLVGAFVEELGWTAFFLPRIMLLTGEILSAVLIGCVWALWHVIPYVQAGHPASWILGQCIFTIVFRILLVRLTLGSGGSVWLAVMCHASYNLAWSLSPGAGGAYDPWITAALTATLVTLLYSLPLTRPTPLREVSS